jgi:hypothetical protein
MRAYAHVLQQSGRRLVPLATSAARQNLRQFTLSRGDVVLVDETGMAGTFLLDQLVAIATAKGARSGCWVTTGSCWRSSPAARSA